MRGQTPFECAQINEILNFPNEYASTLDYWCTLRSGLFPKTTAEAVQTVKKYLRVRLEKIDEYLANRDMRFFSGEGESESLLQFVCYYRCYNTRYGRDLTEYSPKLVEVFGRFGKMESPKVEGGHPEEMLKKSLVGAERSY